MKTPYKLITVLVISGTVAVLAEIQKEDGRAGATGSPGETTCNTSQCHVGNPVNAAGGSITIDVPSMPNWEYIPGQTYPVSVTVSRQNVSLFGFGFEALRSTGANGGTLAVMNSDTQLKSAVVSGNIRTNVVHTLNGGASSGLHTFTFNWTAPASGTGNITFYAAGNAANNNGSASGDFIYTTNQVVTPSTVGLSENPGYFENFSISPNPCTDKTIVQFVSDESTELEIRLVTISGKLVSTLYSGRATAGQNEYSLCLDPGIAKGLYLLDIISGSARKTTRIVRI